MNQYYICYPEGKNKALTFSYDDGKKSDRKLVKLFNHYGLKGTFHLNGGLFSDSERIERTEVKKLYNGHEVAGHTYTHPTIERCPLEMVALEVIEDRKSLESLVNYPVQGFSYPNGSYTNDIKRLLPSLGIEYSRVVGNSHQFFLPKDWFEWQATCHHNHNLINNGNEFVSLKKNQYLYLMYVWGHSYEFDQDQNWELIEEFCQMVTNENDIWFVTNIDFKRYMDASRNLVHSIDGKTVLNPSAISVWISVNGQIYEIEPGINKLKGLI